MSASNPSVRNIVITVGLITSLVVLYIYVAMHQQKTRNADGVYYNRCCGMVYVHGDTLQTQRAIVPAHQAVMKFGLTVYPDRDPRLFSDNAAPLPREKLPPLQFNSVNHPKYFDTWNLGVGAYRFWRCACNENCCQSGS